MCRRMIWSAYCLRGIPSGIFLDSLNLSKAFKHTKTMVAWLLSHPKSHDNTCGGARAWFRGVLVMWLAQGAWSCFLRASVLYLFSTKKFCSARALIIHDRGSQWTNWFVWSLWCSSLWSCYPLMRMMLDNMLRHVATRCSCLCPYGSLKTLAKWS